ncbi:MAG: malonate transporter [Gammaproteobacteria bacterium]|jgi:malonate transporter
MNPVLNVTVPVFSIVCLSFVLAKTGVFGPATSDGLTRFMFYVAIPAMLFRTLATAELPNALPWTFVFAFYGPSFLVFGCAMLLARFSFRWPRREHGIAAISGSYSNMVMLGFPIVVTAFAETGAVPLFILLACQSTLIFPVTTWFMEIYGRESGAKASSIGRTVLNLIMNPVILSLLLGIAANLTSFEITGVADRVLEMLGAAGPACALVALGTGLAQYEFRGDLRPAIILSVCKCFLHPALVWVFCWILDIPQQWTQVAVLLAAMPTGINAFIFARKYDAGVAVVSKTILLSTVFSIFSVSYLLSQFL